MPTYIARFVIDLKVPIPTNEGLLPDLKVLGDGNPVTETLISAQPSGGFIRELKIAATYAADDVRHLVTAGKSELDGIWVVNALGLQSAPWHAAYIIAPMLYQITGLTLHGRVYWDLFDNLSTQVREWTWQMPNGTVVPAYPREYPFRAMRVLSDSGQHGVTRDDWETLQRTLSGVEGGVPMWRLLLADAHRQRTVDIRDVVLRCASALDAGVSPFLPPNTEFNLPVLRGEVPGLSRDMRNIDPALYATLEKLWHTRSGVIHKGEAKLYDQRPSKSGPIRDLQMTDVEEFLCAVPRAIEFMQASPP